MIVRLFSGPRQIGGTVPSHDLPLSLFLSMRSVRALPVRANWLLLAHCLHYLRVLDSGLKKDIPSERRPPMKVKTNTKAGSAMWGS